MNFFKALTSAFGNIEQKCFKIFSYDFSGEQLYTFSVKLSPIKLSGVEYSATPQP